eukprot:6196108-Pleurochrysis_carterae.AAC.4
MTFSHTNRTILLTLSRVAHRRPSCSLPFLFPTFPLNPTRHCEIRSEAAAVDSGLAHSICFSFGEEVLFVLRSALRQINALHAMQMLLARYTEAA